MTNALGEGPKSSSLDLLREDISVLSEAKETLKKANDRIKDYVVPVIDSINDKLGAAKGNPVLRLVKADVEDDVRENRDAANGNTMVFLVRFNRATGISGSKALGELNDVFGNTVNGIPRTSELFSVAVSPEKLAELNDGALGIMGTKEKVKGVFKWDAGLPKN